MTHAGSTVIEPGTYIIDSGDAILLDLTGYPNGSYTFRARWADASGWWSDWSDPINAVKSNKPNDFRIK